MDAKEKIDQIVVVLEQIAEDTSIPRNIRKGAKESKEELLDENKDLDVRTASVTFTMDELANDPNIPLHARTQIWNIMSALETLE